MVRLSGDFALRSKEVLCGIYKPVFWRKNGLFVPNWITFWSKTIKKEDYRTMKNLKKVLSLVLALAMALSLMTAASLRTRVTTRIIPKSLTKRRSML